MAILVLSIRAFLIDPRLMTLLPVLVGMVGIIQDILPLLVPVKDTREILRAVVGMLLYCNLLFF